MKTALALVAALASTFSLNAYAQTPAAPPPAPPPVACTPDDGLSFICGLRNVEDLIVDPAGRWIYGSAYLAGGPGLYLIDAQHKSAKAATLTIASGAGAAPYTGCAAPDLKTLLTHGLELRPGANGVHTLYVINHGGRESIEVFSVDARGAEPSFAWIGCLLPPAPMEANGMAALPGGALAVTKFRDKDQPFTDILAGKITGATYVWRPGQGFTELPGLRMAANNGLLASPDGKTLYIAEYGTKFVHRVRLDGSAPPVKVATLAHPDNMHWDRGKILVGQHFSDTVKKPGDPRGWVIQELDPAAMTLTTVVRKAGGPVFDNGTTGVRAGGQLWIGVFQGDRIAYLPAP